jgi:phosphoribosyl-ATP pyrophosphohydrolase
MKDFWNERYARKEYIYGRVPNEFFKNFIDKHEPMGSLLLPAEGEGRNAVYAAIKGWQVWATDFSEEARKKAVAWAQHNNVEIAYEVADLNFWDTEFNFDAIALIYMHLPPELRTRVHKKLIGKLKPGGVIILEAFSKKQTEYGSGGPSDTQLLYSTDILRDDFAGLKIDYIQERLVDLDEGFFHSGEASVIRMIAKNTNL